MIVFSIRLYLVQDDVIVHKVLDAWLIGLIYSTSANRVIR